VVRSRREKGGGMMMMGGGSYHHRGRSSSDGGGRQGDLVGFAAHHADVAIMGREGRRLRVGEVGEIVTRGPHVMKGYWNKPEATSQSLRGGWLHTGDLGYMDEEGRVYFMGRAKELIRSGGESVFPSEVEKVRRRRRRRRRW